MKIQVLYDKEGKIISAAYSMPPTMDPHARCGPVPKENQHAAEFELPEELTRLKPHELGLLLHERLQVDTKSIPHKLLLKNK